MMLAVDGYDSYGIVELSLEERRQDADAESAKQSTVYMGDCIYRQACLEKNQGFVGKGQPKIKLEGRDRENEMSLRVGYA